MIKCSLHFRTNGEKNSPLFYIVPIFILQVNIYYWLHYAVWS